MSQSESSDAHSNEPAESIRDRVQKLRQKVSDLSETLERVERTAAESAEKIKQ